MAQELFLSAEELAALTGIRTGRCGRTREQRQIEALKTMKVPHYVNAARRPVVLRAAMEGVNRPVQEQGWEPAAA